MIHALLQYAEDRGIVSKPGYTKKIVKWILNFDKDGKNFTGIVPSNRSFLFAPDLSQGELKTLGAKMGMGTHFLIAPIGAVIGWGNDEKNSEIERVRKRTFIWMLNEASAYDDSFHNLAAALLDPEISRSIHQEVLKQNPRVKPQDSVTMCVGGRFPVEENSWHEWWDQFRLTLTKPDNCRFLMPSFGTGKLVSPALIHPKLKQLSGVGLSQPHAPIVTFDKSAFESYGLSQGMNAAMDIEAANTYVAAIDNLLENSLIYNWHTQTKKTNKELVTDRARIGGARIAYWYIGSSEMRKEIEEKNDLIALVLGSADKKKAPPENPIEERVMAEARLRKALDSIRSGERRANIGSIHFCILALSGAGGRVMVRDFMEGTVLRLASTTENWFSDLSLITYSGETSGPLPGLEQILTAPLPSKKPRQDYLDWVAPVGAWRQSLWRAAFTDSRLPETAFVRALSEHDKAIIRGDLTDSEIGHKSQRLSRFRLALVKAYLIRKGVTMNSALDPEHPSAAYHCGRLLAVYDFLQRTALGDVGAGIVQRFYGGALTNPSGVFGQLSRMAQTYLAKLDGGRAYIYTERIAEIHNGIRKNGDKAATYPSALDLDGQALFALGFWHQIAAINKERADAIAAKKAKQVNKPSETNVEEENYE